MRILRAIAIIAPLLMWIVVSQADNLSMPVTPQPIQWHASAFGYDGKRLSNSGSPESVWTGRAVLDWPAYTNRVAVLIGKQYHSYSIVVDVRTNTSLIWPPNTAPTIVRLYNGEYFLCLSLTNPPGNVFYKAYLTTDGNHVSISDSTDCISWNSSFLLVPSSDPTLTILRQ